MNGATCVFSEWADIMNLSNFLVGSIYICLLYEKSDDYKSLRHLAKAHIQ